MSTAFPNRILTEKQAEIFSELSRITPRAPSLRALQSVLFSCVLRLHEGEDPRRLEAQVGMASRDAASTHSLSDQLVAMGHFESTLLGLLGKHSAGESATEAVTRTIGFLARARRQIFQTYPDAAAQSGFAAGEKGWSEASVRGLMSDQVKRVHTQKISALAELVSNIAHEINNPLTGIVGFAELLLDADVPRENREKIELMRQDALRCKRIVQELLDAAFRHEPQKQPVDLHAMVQSVMDRRAPLMRTDGIDFVVLLGEGRPFVLGDFSRLQTLIRNIVDNAHQAIVSSGKGDIVAIRIEEDAERGQVSLFVSDNGPGIAPRVLPRIFDPFFTTGGAGKGAGLGLSIADTIAREHGGEILVPDGSSDGVTFCIRLPLAEAAESPVRLEPTPEAEAVRPAERRALVVDDEEVILDLMETILGTMKVSVETAHNGREALDKVQEMPFDFIICDLKMPGMDGMTFYREIEKSYPELLEKILFSTGDALSEDSATFLESTGCRYVQKPFLIKDIKRAIEALTSK
jgi:signal transduction histidine kinase/CheY-like chemotaxis protein